MTKVVVIMGSEKDWYTVKSAIKTLKEFKVPFGVHVLSAHRSPDDLLACMKKANEEGCKVYICAAGKAAHLAGVVAAHTIKPVIGLPIGGSLNGLDSLFSTVQMPSGIPVATVAVDGAVNAAILAVEILALSDESLENKLKAYREELRSEVVRQDEEIQSFLG